MAVDPVLVVAPVRSARIGRGQRRGRHGRCSVSRWPVGGRLRRRGQEQPPPGRGRAPFPRSRPRPVPRNSRARRAGTSPACWAAGSAAAVTATCCRSCSACCWSLASWAQVLLLVRRPAPGRCRVSGTLPTLRVHVADRVVARCSVRRAARRRPPDGGQPRVEERSRRCPGQQPSPQVVARRCPRPRGAAQGVVRQSPAEPSAVPRPVGGVVQ